MFLEGIGSASIVNGVLRVETFYRNAKGEDVAGEDIIIPSNRIVSLTEALQSLIAQIREKDTETQGLAGITAE